jgi:hypothetical protein
MNFSVTIKTFQGYFSRSSGLISLVLAVVLFCSVPIQPALAQEDSLKLVQKDTRAIVPRYPSKEHLAKFQDDRDYQYKDDPEPPGNPFEKFINRLWRRFRALFTGSSYENFWQYVIMAGALAVVIFILYKAKVLEYIFPSKAAVEGTDYEIGQENIHEIRFDEATAAALSVGDYRLAIRLQYLKTLKMLSSKDLIHWKPNRTNHSYVQELEKYPHQADFVQLTEYFEFAWYGDFRVDEAGYHEMKAFSEAFYTKLNRHAYV